MGSGVELILGFDHTTYANVLKQLEISFDEKDCEIAPSLNYDKLNFALIGAHERALTRVGFTITQYVTSQNDMWKVVTPLGERQLKSFQLEIHFDPGEMNETLEDAILGISISSRYLPTFADWKNQHGSIYPYVFNLELQNMMDIAKDEIVKAIPAFKDAVWVVKEKWY